MALPPLYRTPHASRLLGPGEFVVYTAKLHPLHGIVWFFLALGFVALAYWVWVYLLLPACICLLIYILPFRNHEVAVTNQRLFIRQGRFQIHSYVIDADHLDHYRLHETAFSSLFHYGTFVLGLRAHRSINMLELPDYWHPMTLLEALTTLNPLFRPKSS